MDKGLVRFIVLSGTIIIFNISVLILFGYIYNYFTVHTYNFILLILMLLIILITVLFIFSLAAVLYTYKSGTIRKPFLWLVKGALKNTFPLAVHISGVLRRDKDLVRRFFIEFNNIAVQAGGERYRPEDVLILLPHCLQNSECTVKLTNCIFDCKRCGKCCIGEICKLVENEGVQAAVVTGGTAARNLVGRLQPGIILSVACERDLTSGIADVKDIPVIGIMNDRPYGPCLNTQVDVAQMSRKLKEILK